MTSDPFVGFLFGPHRRRDGSDATTFASQIDTRPAFLTGFDIRDVRCPKKSAPAAESKAQKDGDHSAVRISVKCLVIGALKRTPRGFEIQPVDEPPSQLLYSIDPPDSSRPIRTSQPRISRLEGKAPPSGQTLIGRRSRSIEALKVQSKSQDSAPIQCKAAFRGIPVDELKQ